MSASDLTVFGNIAQALGTAYTSATGNIWLEFNTQNKRVVDDEGVERIGAGAATLGTDGSLTVSGIPKPGSTNPTSFQCVIKYDLRAVLPHARRTNREVGDFGWMTLTGTNRTVTNKALTSNVATITVSEEHGLRVGDPITIAGVDATFDGDHTITAVTATTVSYAKTASNVASTAATGTLYSSYMNLAVIEEEQAVPAEYMTQALAVLQAQTTQATFATVARAPDLIIDGAITRDTNGAATSAPVTWPDGTPGTYTADTVSTAFPGAVDAYHITYEGDLTVTYTQPEVTRDVSSGAVTDAPAIEVS